MSWKEPKLEPGALKAIKFCKEKGSELFTIIEGFKTDEEALILRDILWQAYNDGVSVTFAPNQSSEKIGQSK